MTPAVQISHLHKRYGSLHALRGLDFVIPQGCFFGLLGPNGAGKSTLINIMAGLARASSGTIAVLGLDVRRDWRQARRALGVVPQELVYDPFFTVREMLRLQSGYFGLGADNYPWIDELIETLSLSDKANTNLQRLSGGMKRRVLIAQALVHKPRVVVLDEPTAGVDVELRQALWAFTQQLHHQGRTIVLTTHYLEEAESLCERIAILNQGELVALDSKDALLKHNAYRYLCVSLAEPPAQLPAGLRERLVSVEGNILKLRLHRERDHIGEVLEALHSAGIRFTDLHTDEPGLEEVFIAMTRRQAHADEQRS